MSWLADPILPGQPRDLPGKVCTTHKPLGSSGLSQQIHLQPPVEAVPTGNALGPTALAWLVSPLVP